MTSNALDVLGYEPDVSGLNASIDKEIAAFDPEDYVRKHPATQRIFTALNALLKLTDNLVAGVEKLGTEAKFLNPDGLTDRWNALSDVYTGGRGKLDTSMADESAKILAAIPDPGLPELVSQEDINWALVHMPAFRVAAPAEGVRDWERRVEKRELGKARLFAIEFSGEPRGAWDTESFRKARNQLQQLTQLAIDSRPGVRAHAAAKDFIGSIMGQYAAAKTFADSIHKELKKAAMAGGITPEIRQHIAADRKAMRDFGSEFTQPGASDKND